MSAPVPSADRSELARRIRAARTYAGFAVHELAERVGLGAQTIKRIEAGRRSVRRFEIWAIAEACGLPREFFEIDFAEMAAREEATVAMLTRIDARLAGLEDRLRTGQAAEAGGGSDDTTRQAADGS
jgi:transcriptional regulator with XRE-family HTH domain